TATDPDTATLSYSLSGTDAALFSIDAANGQVRFLTAPDFEAPADADSNNTYQIVVGASDGTLSTTKNVDISVTDVNDAPPAIVSAGQTLTVTAGQTSGVTILGNGTVLVSSGGTVSSATVSAGGTLELFSG